MTRLETVRSAKRHVGGTVGLMLETLYGRGTYHLIDEVERLQFLSADRFRQWQHERLRALLEHCYDYVPFYRRRFAAAGLERANLSEPGVLQRLPVLDKEDVRRHAADLTATDRRWRMRSATTSGSTGRPLTVRSDMRVAAWSRAVQRRAFRWHGVEPYDRRILLLAAPQTMAARLRHGLVDALTGRRLFMFHDLSPGRLTRLAVFLRRYRPAILTAYPSVLAELCSVAHDVGVDLGDTGLELIHTQSEQLFDFQRDAIRRVFGDVPILNEYGCVEVGAMGYTCPCETMHVSHDFTVLEVVDADGEPAGEGETGRILLTPLHARGMPLLRYNVGDQGTIAPAVCGCGRMPGLAVLTELSGRTFDKIIGRGGQEFSAGIVHFLVRRALAGASVREYMARQAAAGALVINIVAPEGIPEGLATRLSEAAQPVFDGAVELEVRVVEQIERPRGRKRSYFVSDIVPSREPRA